MRLPFIILGAGGHGKVLLDALTLSRAEVIGFSDPDTSLYTTKIAEIPVLGDDKIVQNYSPGEIRLANGIGFVGTNIKRKTLYHEMMIMGYRFGSVIHLKSVVSSGAYLADGVQIMAGAIIQSGASIKENTIINTGAIIDHDCVIEKHSHIGPGAVLSGNVSVGEGSHVGSGACILQGLKIGPNALVGAGAVVIRDVLPGTRVVGVPARPIGDS